MRDEASTGALARRARAQLLRDLGLVAVAVDPVRAEVLVDVDEVPAPPAPPGARDAGLGVDDHVVDRALASASGASASSVAVG